MTRSRRPSFLRLAAGTALAAGTLFAQASSPALPDAPEKDTVQRVCGACHPATVVLGRGMTKEEWGQVVASMVSRGAKGSPTDFATVTDYLAKNLPPKSAGAGTNGATGRRPRGGGGGGGFQMGPSDRQVVDPEAAQRGKTFYDSKCETCHGALARGGPNAPDLNRSLVVLHDRYGSTLSPYLTSKHPEPGRVSGLSEQQMLDLTHYLHQQVENTLRSGPYTKVLNVLTGDPHAGEAYFNGAGGCAKCHSVAAGGDLAGIASRFDAPTLQQRLLFPRTVALGRGAVTETKPVTVAVTPQGGQTTSGTLVRMDDFNVSLRDSSGEYHSWKRTAQLKVEKNDPYMVHDELLDKITDKDIHNLVAYLETLK